MGNRWANSGNSVRLFLGGSKITADGDCSHEIKRCLLLGRKVMTNLDNILKSRHYFVNKGPSSQDYGFSCGHVRMWKLDCEEGWALKNWCFWTVVQDAGDGEGQRSLVCCSPWGHKGLDMLEWLNNKNNWLYYPPNQEINVNITPLTNPHTPFKLY